MLNFCWILYDNITNKIENYELSQINNVKECCNILIKIKSLNANKIFIERQLSKNLKCYKYQTVIETFCILNNILYDFINPKNKFKKMKVNIEDIKKYKKRKDKSIELGYKLIKENLIYIDVDKVNKLPKKDDLFDCILMAYTNNLKIE